ncbi:MAG: UDP-4-amino-4,6-dideoxy-N-acetyl-beta-L-altrosamine transaminase [Balneolaceae bacterium]|nr:UDP-4-amino-4,6-dideoxy-N-acetyl-beta-L-altrosamine transaminase [Balneolaceae bacterium]
MNMDTPIPYGRQSIDEEDIRAVTEVLRSNYLTQGPRIPAFEEEFAGYIGCEHAVAVANGTAALHLGVLALGLQPGQKVITTPLTFAASANCVRYAGGLVDFVDIDPHTWLMDLDALERKLEKAPEGTYAGVIPVDFTGLAVDTEGLRELADRHGLWILEDACHAPGGSFLNSQGETVRCGDGRYADAAIFSFHPVKHIAAGEGGMVTTNDPGVKERLELLRTHGITKDPERLRENHGGWYYEMQELGYNFRLTDMQCALGRSQLRRADERLERRRRIAARYDEAFAGHPSITRQAVDPETRDRHHAWHLYVIGVPERKKLYDRLHEQQILCQVHYIPVHLQPYYRDRGWEKGDFPRTEAYYERCLSLPMYPTLSDEQQEYVIRNVLKALDS